MFILIMFHPLHRLKDIAISSYHGIIGHPVTGHYRWSDTEISDIT